MAVLIFALSCGLSAENLYPNGQGQPKLQNSLKGKAKADGEDVLTPLIQQTATNILTEVTKK